MGSVLYILFSIAIGFLALRCLLGIPPGRSLVLLSFASVGLGFGISSLIYFVSFLLQLPVFATPLLETIIAVLLWWRGPSATVTIFDSGRPTLPTPRGLALCFGGLTMLAVIASSVSFFSAAFQSPHGSGDAYMIWNLKARFLDRSDSGNWQSVFSNLISYSHPDYPLLLSGFIARTWHLFGNESVIVPIMTQFLFAMSTAGLLLGALAYLRSTLQACLATLFLLCTPFFWVSTLNQFADMPLSFFFLASVTFLFLAYEQREELKRKICLMSVGIFTSLSMWTKNEGILFFIVIIAAMSLHDNSLRNFSQFKRQLSYFLSGAAPVLVILAGFKIFLVPANDLVAAQGSNTWTRISDLSRYSMVFKSFFNYLFTFGKWGIAPLVMALIFVFAMGKSKHVRRSDAVTGIFIIVSMLAGFFMIYINTHLGLEGHLNSSLDRLYLQLLPTMLLIVSLILRSPEEYLEEMRQS